MEDNLEFIITALLFVTSEVLDFLPAKHKSVIKNILYTVIGALKGLKKDKDCIHGTESTGDASNDDNSDV